MGLLIPVAILAFLLGDDDDSAYAYPIPGQVTPGQVIPGTVFPATVVDVPTWDPDVDPAIPATVVDVPTWDPDVDPAIPATVVDIPTTDVPTAQSLVDVYDDFVRPNPTPGYLYAIKAGDSPSEVLNAAYGNASSFTWQCFTTSRWNLQLYGTAGTPGTSWSKDVDGTLAQVTAAWFQMHDPVRLSMQFGRLPQRTILWPRGSNGQVQPRQPPLPLAGPKTYGTVMLPLVVDCLLPPEAPGKNPAPLFTKLGISIPEWSAWD